MLCADTEYYFIFVRGYKLHFQQHSQKVDAVKEGGVFDVFQVIIGFALSCHCKSISIVFIPKLVMIA